MFCIFSSILQRNITQFLTYTKKLSLILNHSFMQMFDISIPNSMSGKVRDFGCVIGEEGVCLFILFSISLFLLFKRDTKNNGWGFIGQRKNDWWKLQKKSWQIKLQFSKSKKIQFRENLIIRFKLTTCFFYLYFSLFILKKMFLFDEVTVEALWTKNE